MSLKTAVAAVLKAMRRARGLSQKNLAEVSSRTYVSKLERAQSSPTLEMMATLSPPMGLSTLTLVALTIGAETGQSIRSLVRLLEEEVTELAQVGVLAELGIPADIAAPGKTRSPSKTQINSAQQGEFCFSR
ncbi:helix-turn-helix domain-containing protein [Pseudomonas sp. v388]|uniref:helix-turn-helix domain-containing protein n=1 Tax=Pseudomonas sp. v388 TaxID=2479849 RepID=UPI000F76B94B|nr:helix-turn-helix domain-containing protein [Pseudomonas sp. v388]RRV10456.1 helix-turn-helix domain-containing protein [Pseudomonas sp. v388]